MEIPADWFKPWFNSPYYHQLYFEHDEAEAERFISSLIARLRPPAESLMVDVACGRGRHSRLLAKHGFDVTGIDLSPNSIDYAKQFETEQLHFFVHDMRLPFWINYFHYAFNFFTSFGYFNTRREHINAIRTIAQSLHPGGVLVLDYLNVLYAAEHLVKASEKILDGVKYQMTRHCDTDHFYKRIVITDPNEAAPVEFCEKVARFTLENFREMFALQKLEITEVFGDYHFGAFNAETSSRLIMFAKKKS